MVETVASVPTTVPDVFRTIAARSGRRCALEADGTRITFAELDRLSNRVAHGLLNEKSSRPVAIMAPLASSSVVLILGALKAGRLFTPVDPRDPPDRVQEIVGQLGARLVRSVEEVSADRDDDPCVELSPERASVVYFTSGSTGAPRGVIRTHAQVVYPAFGHGIREDDRVGLIIPPAFSGSLAVLYSPVVTGATGCFFDPTTRSVESLPEWINVTNVTLFQTAPSALSEIARAMDAAGQVSPAVRTVIIGGEPCESAQLELARSVFPNATIVNHYGSTEAGFLASTRIAPGDPLPSGPVPLRRVYQGQIVSIVDEDGRPVPVGEPGEIHVARSRNVMLGFWGPPQEGDRLPVDHGDGLRSIQLRDRARLHADGTLELLGRSDLRVKVHGQNVDLQAVERALEALPAVREAIVSAVPGAHGQPRLVAHVAFMTPTSGHDLRRALSATLPPYAIPWKFLEVEAVPRNARGKIDRAALRDAAATTRVVEGEYVAPRTAREEVMASLAAEALGLPRVGVRDDLFDRGMDSLRWAGLLTAINEQCGVDLWVGDLLEAPTVELLAQRGSAGTRTRDRVVVPTYTGGTGTPLFCVAGGGGAGTFGTRRLGRLLGRPTYSFVYRGAHGRAVPDRTVAKVAARFVAGLREIQPEGPYLIGGLSFGGLLAFEMARQLEAGGQQVALLVLIDPVTRWRWQVVRTVRRLRGELVGKEAGRVPLSRRVAGLFRKAIVRQYEIATAGVVQRAPMDQRVVFYRLDMAMCRRYVPQPYSGRTLLLRTSEWRSFDDRDLSRSLVGPTRVETVLGTHATMFDEVNLARMSALIRQEIAGLFQDS